jgi:YjbE family integral membrane protein
MTFEYFSALIQVILVDLVLAGDNVIVIGLAASAFPSELRRRIIIFGLVFAAVARISFTAIAAELLQFSGIMLVGGLLLLWVCWSLWRDLSEKKQFRDSSKSISKAPPASISRAALQIVVADLSMSLDNILAVAAIARERVFVLVVGLALSIALMAISAEFVSKILIRYQWVAFLGMAVIVYVALSMIWIGTIDLAPNLPSYFSEWLL